MNTNTRTFALAALLAAGLLLGAGSPEGQAPKKKKRPPRDQSWAVTKVPAKDVICFALYTVHNNVLKLTAQLYQLDEDAPRTVRLQIKRDGQWRQIAETQVIERGSTAPFRVENWDATKDYEYRVAHGDAAFYTGRIRRDPVDKEEIVVAAFTGNSNQDRSPRTDLIENLKKQDPDILFFSGDQVYDHGRHFPAWLLFGRQFGEVIRDRPTICIPDDHDVGNGNLWGAAGKVGPDGYRDAEFVKEVERAQTSHLPDPYDPAPIQRGIGVYFTGLRWGRIGFAVLEDRKFKSQTDILDHEALKKKGVVFTRADHIQVLPDVKMVDVPEARLLGERQLKFLRQWAADWEGTDMKVALSQTIFAGAAHVHGGRSSRLEADLDCNGWPQSGRNHALAELRKAFALMIGGDQHLATVIQHGTDEWGDAGFSFCVPSIVNYYNRWWSPAAPGANPVASFRGRRPLKYTGQYRDGFDNKVTMYAYANPDPDRPKLGKWGARAAGHGIVRFNKRTRKITIECWRRGCDVTDPKGGQFRGWPITIDQLNNYGRKAAAFLPTLKIDGQTDPVVQIIDESNKQIVYTLRIKGTTLRPKVFAKGTYTIKVGEGENRKTLRGVETVGAGESKKIEVSF